MPEPVAAWWARRQWSKRAAVPYAVGEFRADWERYPWLIRQYHPDLNGGVSLTQIPPAADVWVQWQCEVGHRFVATPWDQRQRPGGSRRRSTWCPECTAEAVPQRSRPRRATPRPAKPPCARTPPLAVGTPFVSVCAPTPASAVESILRARLRERLLCESGANAIVVGTAFFDHFEVWPDIILSDLRVAIEYDSIGRTGVEHVGKREAIDRRKDRLLRLAGWEVIRIRTGKLQPIGPWDLCASGTITNRLVDELIDRLCDIRGPLLVAAYLSDPAASPTPKPLSAPSSSPTPTPVIACP